MDKVINTVNVTCNTCGKNLNKKKWEVKKVNNHYCNHSCAAKDANKNRKLDPSRIKKLNCSECNSIFEAKANSSYKSCGQCRSKVIKIIEGKSFIIKACARCKVSSTDTKRGDFCAPCRKIVRSEKGVQAGKKAAAVRNKRSKNEIYFYELCKAEWENAKPNEPFFESKYGKWDADVIIHEHKIAVLWNGVWHYKQVRAKHSLAQVQARDKIKIDSILAASYTPYVIKDMGKYNPKFVEEEFLKFKEFVTSK